MTLGSGNIRRAAYLKLSSAGLANYFPSGAFSSSGTSRADIIRQAALPLASLDRQMIVVGDTPKDVDAARQNAFFSIAVSTGHFSTDELLRCGATFALPHLSHIPTFLAAIRSIMA